MHTETDLRYWYLQTTKADFLIKWIFFVQSHVAHVAQVAHVVHVKKNKLLTDTIPENLYDPYIEPMEFCFDFRSCFVLILRHFRGLIVCVFSNVAIISQEKRKLTALL